MSSNENSPYGVPHRRVVCSFLVAIARVDVIKYVKHLFISLSGVVVLVRISLEEVEEETARFHGNIYIRKELFSYSQAQINQFRGEGGEERIGGDVRWLHWGSVTQSLTSERGYILRYHSTFVRPTTTQQSPRARRLSQAINFSIYERSR